MNHKIAEIPRPRGILIAGTFLFLLALGLEARAQVTGFPLRVENPSNFDRFDAPVASGLPLPWFLPITNPDLDFLLLDDLGNPVPATSKVLARWGGERGDGTKRAKWVLICFNADVPANSTRTYFIVPGTTQPGSMIINETATEVTVATGAAIFTIDKVNATFFKQVDVAGQTVVATPGSLEMRDIAGGVLNPVLQSTAWEQQTATRSVLRQKGYFQGLALEFTIRYYFMTGHSDVKVDFRLENHGNYGEIGQTGNSIGTQHFDSFKMNLSIADTSPDVVTTNTVHDPAGGSYKLEQDFGVVFNSLDMESALVFTETLGASTANTGNKYDGALALNGTTGSLSVAVDRFWQNFPKAFEVSGGTLSVALWPSFGYGPIYRGQYGTPTSNIVDLTSTTHYRFEGGRWKTHTFVVDFRDSGQTGYVPGELYEQAESLAKPLMARPVQEWPFRLWAFGDLLVERRNWTDLGQVHYERMMDILVDDSAADNQPALGQIGLPEFRKRGGTYGGRQMYGWENFGDIAWGDGFSSLHYDLPFGVLINYWRTGDYAFFDMARDLCAHRRDYDQCHTTHPSSPRRGGQSYEKGYTHGNYNAPEPSHTWVHGLLLYYVTTGDEGAFESALEVGEFYARTAPENWTGWWGSRILGWQLEGLMNLWNYVGKQQYLLQAQATVQNWEQLDQADGLDGMHANPGWSTPHAQSWMHAIVLNAISKYYINSYDQSAVPIIKRMADWFRDDVVKDYPTGPPNSCTTATVWERVGDATNGYRANPSTHHTWATAQALSYASMVFFDQTYYDTAQALWNSVARYHQIQEQYSQTPRDWTNPGTFSPVAFRMMNFPNSETKIMGNIILWGQAGLASRCLWEFSW